MNEVFDAVTSFITPGRTQPPGENSEHSSDNISGEYVLTDNNENNNNNNGSQADEGMVDTIMKRFKEALEPKLSEINGVIQHLHREFNAVKEGYNFFANSFALHQKHTTDQLDLMKGELRGMKMEVNAMTETVDALQDVKYDVKDFKEDYKIRMSNLESNTLRTHKNNSTYVSSPGDQRVNNNSNKNVLDDRRASILDLPRSVGGRTYEADPYIDKTLNANVNTGPNVYIQKVLVEFGEKLNTLSNPDKVGDHYRAISIWEQRFPGQKVDIALTLTPKVIGEIVTEFGIDHMFNADTIYLKPNELIHELMKQMIRPKTRELFITKLKKSLPYALDPRSKGDTTVNSFRFLAQGYARILYLFIERYAILYDPNNSDIAPEIHDKTDGTLDILFTHFNTCTDGGQYLKNFWSRLPEQQKHSVKKCIIEGKPVSKVASLKYLGDLVRARIKEDAEISDASRGLSSNMGLPMYTGSKRSNDQITKGRGSDERNAAFAKGSKSYGQSRPNNRRSGQINHIDHERDQSFLDFLRDTTDFDGESLTYSDSEDDDEDAPNVIPQHNESEDALDGEMLHAIGQPPHGESRPNGCYDMIFYGTCKRTQGTNRDGKAPACSYSHEPSVLTKTCAWTMKMCSASKYKPTYEPKGAGGRLSMLTRQVSENDKPVTKND